LKARSDNHALDGLLRTVSDERLGIGAIRRYLVDEDAIDLVFQDVLVAVATTVSSYEGRSAFSTWLYSVAANQAKLFLRAQSRRAMPAEPAESAVPVWTQETVAERVSSLVAFRESLNSVMSEIPANFRDAVVLRDVERLSYVEIADHLQLEVNTVRSRIHRGRALLAKRLAEADVAQT